MDQGEASEALTLVQNLRGAKKSAIHITDFPFFLPQVPVWLRRAQLLILSLFRVYHGGLPW